MMIRSNCYREATKAKLTPVPMYLKRKGHMGPHYDDGCCLRCGKPLTAIVWLELDQRTGEYTDAVPAEFSQGGFEFGPDCADILRARAAITKAQG